MYTQTQQIDEEENYVLLLVSSLSLLPFFYFWPFPLPPPRLREQKAKSRSTMGARQNNRKRTTAKPSQVVRKYNVIAFAHGGLQNVIATFANRYRL